LVKFRIKVRDPSGDERWEEEEREIGPQRRVRGYGIQPDFTGDINQWGLDIVAWYNSSEPRERHRVFIKAEILKGKEHGE